MKVKRLLNQKIRKQSELESLLYEDLPMREKLDSIETISNKIQGINRSISNIGHGQLWEAIFKDNSRAFIITKYLDDALYAASQIKPGKEIIDLKTVPVMQILTTKEGENN
jgi:hypothetical protein